MTSLSGKNIIITGATSGLGVEIAKSLSAAGASVFIGGRRAEQGQQVANDMGATFHTVDVADETSNKAFFEAAQKHFGGEQTVDYILLNAGVEGNHEDAVLSSEDSFKIDHYDYIYSVNVRGALLGLSYGIKLLRKHGKFLVTSSAGSVLALGAVPVYISSKAALDSLVRSYAAQFKESKDERIQSLSIVSINPTLYLTEMVDRFVGGNLEFATAFAKMTNPVGRPGKAEELATVVTDFARGQLPYQSGHIFVADADTHFPIEEYTNRLQKAPNA
ncbi:hypothetical protein ACA910_021829 [Epithemia clementina (nom. ined.)]